ncbi:signal peptidase II [bacterium]|nr:signal peptidase II [bacterium]
MHWKDRGIWVSCLLLATVGCDQATKIVARDALANSGSHSYLGDLLRVELVQNPGAFLSMGANLSSNSRFWIFNIAVTVLIAAIGVALYRSRKSGPLFSLALALIFAGGVGNIIDRFMFGSVTDFLNIGIGNLRTGIFNVADMAVSAGAVLAFILPWVSQDALGTRPPESARKVR